MPREKVTMGVGTYGRTFALADPNQTGVGAPAKGPGEAGKYTREPGFLAYFEVRCIHDISHFLYVLVKRSVRN